MGSPNPDPADSLLESIENLNLNGASSASTSSATSPATTSAVSTSSASSSADWWPSIGRYGYGSYPTPVNSIVIAAALTPQGSQTLQEYISCGEPGVMNTIFRAAIDSIFDLMMNQSGHHVFGTLIPLCNDHQLLQIARKLAIHPQQLVSLSINRFGSPSIKRFIKQMAKSNEAASIFIKALSMVFTELMISKTGCHVIYQCLESLNIPLTNSLYQAAIDTTLSVATNVHGCLALNNVVAASRGHTRKVLLDSISDFSVYLAQDPYGNFVIQYLLGLENPEITEKICRLLKGRYLAMSMLKGSSHVVEKCLKSLCKGYVVDEFIRSPNNVLLQVARHQYGNYVVQTAINETMKNPKDLSLHVRLVAKIGSMIQFLQRGYGRNVYNLIAQMDGFGNAM